MHYPKLKVKDLIDNLGGADKVYFSLKQHDQNFKYNRLDSWIKRNALPIKFFLYLLLNHKIDIKNFVTYDNQTKK